MMCILMDNLAYGATGSDSRTPSIEREVVKKRIEQGQHKR
jgi:hypothetical protein